MSLSMGPIIDRSREHLVPADRAVVTLRKLLLRSAKKVEEGGEPVAIPGDITDVRAPDVFFNHEMRAGWVDIVPGHWKPRQAEPRETVTTTP
jgi:hypothetical protein